MNITYNFIRDLLSRNAKKKANSDLQVKIDEHLSERMKSSIDLNHVISLSKFPVDTDNSPLLRLKSTLRKKKPQTVIFSMIALVFVILVLSYLTAPEYIPYHEEIVAINETGKGSVLVEFGEDVSGYDLNRYPSDKGSTYVYHLTTWDSIWNRNIAEIHVDNLVLNPTGEAVAAVYYYEPDGSEDLLIYGENQNPRGGVMTLPRLFLAYYARIALSLVMICAFLIILFRRHKKVTDLAIKILFLPVSYLIGLILIKGMKTSSYNALRDFYVILLIMIPLYIALFLALSLYKTYRKKTIQ